MTDRPNAGRGFLKREGVPKRSLWVRVRFAILEKYGRPSNPPRTTAAEEDPLPTPAERLVARWLPDGKLPATQLQADELPVRRAAQRRRAALDGKFLVTELPSPGTKRWLIGGAERAMTEAAAESAEPQSSNGYLTSPPNDVNQTGNESLRDHTSSGPGRVVLPSRWLPPADAPAQGGSDEPAATHERSIVQGPDPSVEEYDRRARAALAFFGELCDEPLARAATAETLAYFAGAAWQFSDDDSDVADEYLLKIARATAQRRGLVHEQTSSPDPRAESPAESEADAPPEPGTGARTETDG